MPKKITLLEEFNCQTVDIVSEYYFAPTGTSKRSLLDEGKPESKILVAGNTGIDTMCITVRKGYPHPEFDWAEGTRVVLTNSGGIQEEAQSLGKSVLVMRNTTERLEGVAAGTFELVGTEEGAIYREFCWLLSDDEEYAAMIRASNPYGDGHASERIAEVLAG